MIMIRCTLSVKLEDHLSLCRKSVSIPSDKNKKYAIARKAENNVEYSRDTWGYWVV